MSWGKPKQEPEKSRMFSLDGLCVFYHGFPEEKTNPTDNRMKGRNDGIRKIHKKEV